MPCIIQVLLFITHLLIIHFVINPLFFPLWMVDANLILSYFFLSHLTFVQSGIHSVVSSYACSMVYFLSYFIYNVLPLLYTFLSCSSHIVNTFLSFIFFNVLASGIWLISHNDVNTRSLSRTHRQCTCTRPVRQMPFRVKRLKMGMDERRLKDKEGSAYKVEDDIKEINCLQGQPLYTDGKSKTLINNRSYYYVIAVY